MDEKENHSYNCLGFGLCFRVFCLQQKSEQIPLTDKELAEYEVYKLDLPDEVEHDPDINLVEFLLKDGVEIGESEVAEYKLIYYAIAPTHEFYQYLYNYGGMKELWVMNDILLIGYFTTDGIWVTLEYLPEGFFRMTLYDESKDELVFISNEDNVESKSYRWTNYRYGDSEGAP